MHNGLLVSKQFFHVEYSIISKGSLEVKEVFQLKGVNHLKRISKGQRDPSFDRGLWR